MNERDRIFIQLGAIFAFVLTLVTVAGLRHTEHVTASALDMFAPTVHLVPD